MTRDGPSGPGVAAVTFANDGTTSASTFRSSPPSGRPGRGRTRRSFWSWSALGCTRALAPLIDPNEHSCGTVRPHGVDELTQPEPGYDAVGMKSYGRAPTFLLATGQEEVRSVVAALAGDLDAARDVQLDLPETGVCSAGAGVTLITIADGGACCG